MFDVIKNIVRYAKNTLWYIIHHYWGLFIVMQIIAVAIRETFVYTDEKVLVMSGTLALVMCSIIAISMMYHKDTVLREIDK